MDLGELNILGSVIGILIGSLIGAIFLVQAFKWIEKRKVSFPLAFSAWAVGTVAYCVIQLTVESIFENAGDSANIVLSIALIPLGCLIQASSVSLITRTRFIRACLVWLVAFAVGLAFFGGIALLVYLIAKLAGM